LLWLYVLKHSLRVFGNSFLIYFLFGFTISSLSTRIRVFDSLFVSSWSPWLVLVKAYSKTSLIKGSYTRSFLNKCSTTLSLIALNCSILSLLSLILYLTSISSFKVFLRVISPLIPSVSSCSTFKLYSSKMLKSSSCSF
jgi:hypothetical protein